MGDKVKSEICLAQGNRENELSKEEKYAKVVKVYLSEVYKISLYLTKDEEKADKMCIKVFTDFYDIFETMISFEDSYNENVIKSEAVLRHLTCMILKKIRQQQ